MWDRYEKEISIVLKIYGDDQLIYQSPVLTSTHDCRVLTLNVSGIKEIRFEMDGEIIQKPLWCAITGTADRYLYDTSKQKIFHQQKFFWISEIQYWKNKMEWN